LTTVRPSFFRREERGEMRALIGMLATAALAVPPCVSQDVPALVGSWRLVVFERHEPSGDVTHPFGRAPRGVLMYTTSGRMSVHLLDPGRPSFASDEFREGSDREVRAAFEGYFGYFGSYSVEFDETSATGGTGTVTHHVEGSAFPNYAGTDRARTMKLYGDHLSLNTAREEGGEPLAWHRVVWERMR
jgi:hypothetical protein